MMRHHEQSVVPENTSLAVGDDREPSTDEHLVDRTRAGDITAYGLLWDRHVASARGAARSISSRLETDDLVSEAFAAILRAIRSGGGPRGAFRPYLYATIRNTAATWGSKPSDAQLDTVSEFADRHATEPSDEVARRLLLAAALADLPPRWRTLLWHLEVEGMKPRELATVLGISSNAVSSMRGRARSGLRRAWQKNAEATAWSITTPLARDYTVAVAAATVSA